MSSCCSVIKEAERVAALSCTLLPPCLRRRQLHSSVVRQTIYKRLLRRQSQRSFCFEFAWLDTEGVIKQLLLLSLRQSHSRFMIQVQWNGRAALFAAGWYTSRAVVEIHNEAAGASPVEQTGWEQREDWTESPVNAELLLVGVVSRYGKRSTPEQAVAWLLFGEDSSQDNEPRWVSGLIADTCDFIINTLHVKHWKQMPKAVAVI